VFKLFKPVEKERYITYTLAKSMKVQILQEELSKVLINSSRFSANKVQLPVLANILLSAKQNKLSISATNLEISIVTSIGAKVIEEGDITVPARVLTEIISNIKPGQIVLSSEKERIKVEATGFSSKISGMNSSDFPEIPGEVGAKSIKIPSDHLKSALSKILFSVSNDETRPALTGVLTIFGSKTFFVATDGFRLSQKEIKIETKKDKSDNEEKIIIPKAVLGELPRMLTGDGVDFSFSKKDNQVVFGFANTILSSRVIEGEFPDFKKIIPKDTKIKVNLDKEEFLRGVKLSSVFARDSANVVKLAVNNSFIEISAESSQSGSQKTKVDAKVDGLSTKFVIAFNYRFLEDFFGSVEADDVTIEFSEPSAPALFLDPKDSNFLHIIMPVRLQD
jgi:DNA polymerase-3 subunit beta